MSVALMAMPGVALPADMSGDISARTMPPENAREEPDHAEEPSVQSIAASPQGDHSSEIQTWKRILEEHEDEITDNIEDPGEAATYLLRKNFLTSHELQKLVSIKNRKKRIKELLTMVLAKEDGASRGLVDYLKTEDTDLSDKIDDWIAEIAQRDDPTRSGFADWGWCKKALLYWGQSILEEIHSPTAAVNHLKDHHYLTEEEARGILVSKNRKVQVESLLNKLKESENPAAFTSFLDYLDTEDTDLSKRIRDWQVEEDSGFFESADPRAELVAKLMNGQNAVMLQASRSTVIQIVKTSVTDVGPQVLSHRDGSIIFTLSFATLSDLLRFLGAFKSGELTAKITADILAHEDLGLEIKEDFYVDLGLVQEEILAAFKQLLAREWPTTKQLSEAAVAAAKLLESESDEVKSVSLHSEAKDSGKGSSVDSASQMNMRIRERYKTGAKMRGMAIIIYNDTFEKHVRVPAADELKEIPKGDPEKLGNLFKKWNFDVTVHRNITCRKMEQVLYEAANTDHTSSDCFALAIISEGTKDVVFGTDGPLFMSRIYEAVDGDRAKTLIGKPKIILLQVPSGLNADSDVIVPGQTVRAPSKADMLICHASWHDQRTFVSRGSQSSWFVECLCKASDSAGPDDDLMSIMTETSRLVAHKAKLFRKNYSRQVPRLESSLRRKVYLVREQRMAEITESPESWGISILPRQVMVAEDAEIDWADTMEDDEHKRDEGGSTVFKRPIHHVYRATASTTQFPIGKTSEDLEKLKDTSDIH